MDARVDVVLYVSVAEVRIGGCGYRLLCWWDIGRESGEAATVSLGDHVSAGKVLQRRETYIEGHFIRSSRTLKKAGK